MRFPLDADVSGGPHGLPGERERGWERGLHTKHKAPSLARS